MNKYEDIIQKYVQIGMRESNIEYAIDAIKYGTERDLIIENLTSTFRKESKEIAEQLLNDIEEVNSSKIKQQKRPDQKSYYSAQQQKIYEDYIELSNETLLEYVNNAFKYRDSVIEVIKDILIERNVLETEEPKINVVVPEKHRHGCVTIWLVFMIVVNAIFSIIYLATGGKFLVVVPSELRSFFSFVLFLVGALNIYFASLLLNWKRSGFVGLSVMAGIMFFVNLAMGFGLLESIIGLCGLYIFYLILKIKKNGISAWDQLE